LITNIGGQKPWFLDIQPGGRGHKRYQRKFKTKAKALAFEITIKQKVLHDSDYHEPVKDNRILQDFVRLWFKNTGQHLSSGKDTHDRLIQASSAMSSPFIRTFKPVVFLDYRSNRIDQGISPATLNRELQTFKSLFSDLIRSGQFEGKNPFLSIRKIKTHQPKTVFLSSEQIITLFSHLKMADSDAYLISMVCLATGARWGEAQALSLSDLSNNMIHFHDTKSKKSRSVPINPIFYKQLFDRLSFAATFKDSYSTFSRRLYDSGIDLPKGQRTHILRHTFASHFMINGGNILVLKEALGHSSLEMTMRYSHLAPDSMLEVLQKNPALMFC